MSHQTRRVGGVPLQNNAAAPGRSSVSGRMTRPTHARLASVPSDSHKKRSRSDVTSWTVSVSGSADHDGVPAGGCEPIASARGVEVEVSATEPETAASQNGSPTHGSKPVAARTVTVSDDAGGGSPISSEYLVSI